MKAIFLHVSLVGSVCSLCSSVTNTMTDTAPKHEESLTSIIQHFLNSDRIVCGRRRVYQVPMMGKGYYRDIHQQYVLYILSPLVSTAVLVHSNVRQLIWDLNTTGLISLYTDLQK